MYWVRFTSSGLSDSVSIWVTLAPNGTNLGLFEIRVVRWAKWRRNWHKKVRLDPFGDNLAQLEAKPDTPDYLFVVTVYPRCQISDHFWSDSLLMVRMRTLISDFSKFLLGSIFMYFFFNDLACYINNNWALLASLRINMDNIHDNCRHETHVFIIIIWCH